MGTFVIKMNYNLEREDLATVEYRVEKEKI